MLVHVLRTEKLGEPECKKFISCHYLMFLCRTILFEIHQLSLYVTQHGLKFISCHYFLVSHNMV